MTPRLTRDEMETVILGNAAGATWDVCTADPRIIRKLERQGFKADNRPNPWGYISFTVPFDRIRIAPARKRTPTGKPFQRHANTRVESDQNLPAMVS
jgi:hypothetical protein